MSVSTNEGKKIHVAISAMAPRIKAYPAKEVGGGEKLISTSKCDPAWKSDPVKRGIGVQNRLPYIVVSSSRSGLRNVEDGIHDKLVSARS